MKRKVLVCATALLLATTSLSACVNTNGKVTFNPYWYTNADATPEHTLEELTYKVAFESSSTTGTDYKAEYKDGVYTTKLTKNENNQYVYETAFSISVRYFDDEVQSEWLNDYATSTVIFKSTANALEPVSVQKEIVSHSPKNGELKENPDFSAWKNCDLIQTDYATNVCKISHNVGKADEQKTEKTIDRDDKKHTYLDNEQLLFALRGLNPATTLSAKFKVYAPFSAVTQTISVTFGSKATAEAFQFEKDGEPYKADTSYYPGKMIISSSKNTGAEQSVWIAALSDSQNNTLHNVIMRYEAPLAYNLGKLVYTLQSANFA